MLSCEAARRLYVRTRQKEGDEASLFWNVQPQSRSAGDKLHERFHPAGTLEEREELLRLRDILRRKKHARHKTSYETIDRAFPLYAADRF